MIKGFFIKKELKAVKKETIRKEEEEDGLSEEWH